MIHVFFLPSCWNIEGRMKPCSHCSLVNFCEVVILYILPPLHISRSHHPHLFELLPTWLEQIRKLVKTIASTLQNWLTLIKFLVMEGTNRRLLRTRGNLELKGDWKVTPEELVFRSWPLPIAIWSGSSKGVTCWMFWETLVTWWDARVRIPVLWRYRLNNG